MISIKAVRRFYGHRIPEKAVFQVYSLTLPLILMASSERSKDRESEGVYVCRDSHCSGKHRNTDFSAFPIVILSYSVLQVYDSISKSHFI